MDVSEGAIASAGAVGAKAGAVVKAATAMASRRGDKDGRSSSWCMSAPYMGTKWYQSRKLPLTLILPAGTANTFLPG